MHQPLFVVSIPYGYAAGIPDLEKIQDMIIPEHAHTVDMDNEHWGKETFEKTLSALFKAYKATVPEIGKYAVSRKNIEAYLDSQADIIRDMAEELTAQNFNSWLSQLKYKVLTSDGNFLVNGYKYCNGPEFSAMLYKTKGYRDGSIPVILHNIYDISL